MSEMISAARREDLPGIQDLLHRCGLPATDVEEHLEHFLVVRRDGGIIGTVGLEVFGNAALLRSLAVEESRRDEGWGKALYERAEEYSRVRGIRELSLLTTTAEGFFAQRGFTRVESAKIADYVKQTKEFRLFCPSTAVCMVKRLAGEGNR